MPVTGFPSMLEGIINNILKESNITSYKIAGNQERTTLVLRFGVMADTCVSNNHHSTPASYRRKPPSQIRRDRERIQHHLSTVRNEDPFEDSRPLIANKSKSTHNQNPKYYRSLSDSAIHSFTESTLSTAHFDITSTMENSYPALREKCDRETGLSNEKRKTKGDELMRKGRFTPVSVSTKPNTKYTKTNISDKEQPASTDLQSINNNIMSSSQPNDNNLCAVNVPVTTVLTEEKSVTTQSSSEDEYSNTESESDSDFSDKDEHISNNDTFVNPGSDHGDRTRTANTECVKTRSTATAQESENNLTQACSTDDLVEHLDCDRTRAQIFDMEFDERMLVTQPDRNNEIMKLLLDTYDAKEAILSETTDLLIEYHVDTQRIDRFILKDGEGNTPYARMRRRHLQNWKEQTNYIKESYKDHVQNIRILLPHLKQLMIDAYKH